VVIQYLAWNPPNLDPLYGSGQSDFTLPAAYNGLLRYDFVDTSKVVPDLAEKWEISADGLTYTFHLRKDVKWQDGTPFSVADVQFTYDRLNDKEQLARSGKWGKTIPKLAEGWSTIDDSTFQIKLKTPNGYFLNFIASPQSRVHPKHMFDAEAKTVLPKSGDYKFGIGTGPFRIVKYEQGSMLEFVKNPFFGERADRQGLPYLDGVKRPIISDRATQVAAMASGRVQIGMQWPAQVPSELKLIKEQSGGKASWVPAYQNGPQSVYFNTQLGPMANPKVQEAIFLAIDRQEIADRVFEGTGEAGTMLDTRLYGDWSLTKAEQMKLPGLRADKTADLARAKELLAEAGYANGLDLISANRATAEYVPTCVVVASQLKKIGINLKLESLDPSAGIRILRKGNWHINCQGGWTGYHALAGMEAYLSAGSVWGFNKDWMAANPEFKAMYDTAVTSLDESEAKKLVKEMQMHLLTKSRNRFPVVWIDSPVVVWNQVKNWYPSVYGMNQGGHDHTIVWLDE
jgi:peptide/nickel transport system substrate-binding protein